MKIKSLILSSIIVAFSILLQISTAEAAKPAKPSSTTVLGSSAYALDVVINEVSVNSSFIELYFNKTTDISDWSISYDASGNSNSGSFKVCDATLTSNPDTSPCGTYTAGTFLLISNVSLHNTLQEILLVDNNTSPPSGNSAVHYFRYTNNANSGGSWEWETSDSSISTIYNANGNKGNLCSSLDGNISIGNWKECSETPNATNADIAIHHFEIDLINGQGLTCEADNITIKACADENCDTTYDDAINVELLINGTVDKIITVSGGNTDTNFSYTTVGTATLSLDETYECKNGAVDSCGVVFASAGFIFSETSALNVDIDNQVAGTAFTAYIRAVENIDGVCTGLFNGDVTVQLSQENEPPTVSGIGLAFTVDDTHSVTKSLSKYTTYTDVELAFNNSSEATLTNATYLDAGKIRLHANYNVGGISLEGSSNTFWVSPAQLIVTAKTGGSVIDGNTNTSITKHKAGQTFDLTVTAYNSVGTLSSNITGNYTPNDIQLLLTRTGPTTAGVDGTLNYSNGTILSSLVPTYQSVTLTAFSSGVSSTNSASYSEVGLLNLDLQDVGYGFSGNIIAGDAINIGRFTPDHFEQTVVEQGSLDSVCNQNTSFAYVGQVLEDDVSKGAISYLVNPVVELTAKNAQGGTTKNYTETGYNKLIAAANFIVLPTTDFSITGKDTNLLPLTAIMVAGTVDKNGLDANEPSFGLPLDAGVLHYELADGDNFFYPRNENSEIHAQDNDINFLIDPSNFVDSDGVAINSPVDITSTLGINLRFGRAYLENSFGLETADLPQRLSTQYLNATGSYVTNDQDSCTNFENTKMTLTSGTLNQSLTSVNVVDSQMSEGEAIGLVLTAPGAGNQGTIGVEYDIYSWLKYDWNWNGIDVKEFDENPHATATFGLFRGNDRIIYQREVF